ncbi:hypothetical protein JXL83_09220 [candidate division WOR-3 bacterium]|nr:hypothetical protein [candidate division WOR-3 bacterium]
MNKYTAFLLAVAGLLAFSCGPKNAEVNETGETFIRAEVEIWKNMMPTVPPSEPNVICNFELTVSAKQEFHEITLIAGMIEKIDGTEISSVTFDFEPIFTTDSVEQSFTVRAVVDYPSRISGGENVFAWLLFYVDGEKVEIESPPVEVKTVY